MGGMHQHRPVARRRHAASVGTQQDILALVDRWIDAADVRDDPDAARHRRTVLKRLSDTAQGIDRLLGLERRATTRRASTGPWRTLTARDVQAIENCIARLREVVMRFEPGIRDKQRTGRALKRLDELEASLSGGKPSRRPRR